MLVAAQEAAEMVIFDLVPTNNSIPGVMTLGFGTPPQKVNVLVAFYTNSNIAAHVPAGVLCSTSSGRTDITWNAIQEPSEGEFVSTSADSEVLQAGMKLVQWRASTNTKTVHISLRKGRGENAENVTVIQSGSIYFNVLDFIYLFIILSFFLLNAN